MYMTYLANPTWDNPNSLLSDEDGKCHFFDITLYNAEESAEDARCIMVEFAADAVHGFEPRGLEVSTSIMLPNHVVCSDPELLEDDFCNVAKYARAEDT